MARKDILIATAGGDRTKPTTLTVILVETTTRNRRSRVHSEKKAISKAGGAKKAFEQKWFSVHKTTTRGNEGCYAHGAPRPEPKGVHLASAVLVA